MMAQRCPVCGQTLPKGMTTEKLHRRMESASRPLVEEARHSMAEEHKQDRVAMEAKMLRRAMKDARAASHREMQEYKARSAKEKKQQAIENVGLKQKVDELSQRLERQTSEQMGEMGEREVFTALHNAFPADEIGRIEKGVGGADILQKVMVEGREVGRIVYECKNGLNWNREWISTAKRYRSEYQTPWVVIAARAFPRRQKWFVVEKNIPVIDLRLTVKLAEVLREAVIQIGHLRISSVGRHAKADQMFQYIVSHQFISRFKGVAEAVTGLRELQTKERQWHSTTWAKQTRLYDEVEDRQREINARIQAISETRGKPRLRVVGSSYNGG